MISALCFLALMGELPKHHPNYVHEKWTEIAGAFTAEADDKYAFGMLDYNNMQRVWLWLQTHEAPIPEWLRAGYAMGL